VDSFLVAHDLDLPPELKTLYATYPTNTEFYVGERTLLCLDEVLAHTLAMREGGQRRLVDVGLEYIGMGHIKVYSHDPVGNKMVMRIDGGANGWDRAANAAVARSMDVDKAADTCTVDQFVLDCVTSAEWESVDQ
jgi:hypothetical protein